MASQIITVDDMINDVRSMLDEDNKASVTDTGDILPALNRAQNYAANILARHYESPMLKWETVNLVAGQNEYDIPESAFEQRLEKVELQINGQFTPIKRLNYRDVTPFESTTAANVPYYYTVIGDRYRLIPNASSSYPLRIWYLEDPHQLVQVQGRINIVNTAGNYIIVDNIGDNLTTETDQLNSYVNIVDGQTGKRKASYQIQNLSGNTITFKTIPSRTNVLNTAIDTSMVPANLLVNQNTDNQGSDVSIQPDDFICVVRGSCVPFFKKPFTNFLIQYAVAEITRKLGGDDGQEQRVLKELEAQVERSWVGREVSLRVNKANETWNITNRKRRP